MWVRDGCNFDISKIFKDGKPLILDATHVDPECYISSKLNEQTGKYEFRIVTNLTTEEEETKDEEISSGLDKAALL